MQARNLVGALLGSFAILACPQAQALTFDLDTVFNGSAPSGSGPWVTAQFSNAGAGVVNLDLSLHLTGSEFLSDLTFNIDPAFSPLTTPLLLIQNSGSPYQIFFFGVDNSVDLVGGGTAGKGFDLVLSFPTAAGQRFSGTATASFTISSLGLTADSFNFLNILTTGNNTEDGILRIGAHIQGIGTDGASSGAITGQGAEVPDAASTLLLLGLATTGLASARRLIR